MAVFLGFADSCDKISGMESNTSSTPKVGYTRYEFSLIFQVYSRNVYTGLFRDFSFTEHQGHYYISFREEAGAIPLITVQKRKLGPDRSLYIATTPGTNGQPLEIVRSEKIEAFIHRLNEEVEKLLKMRTSGRRSLKVVR
jgi:hypothetical protein